MRTIRSQNDALTEANQKLRESNLEIIRILRLAVDARDIYTRGHSDRVSYYAGRLAESLGRDEVYCNRVRVAGLFHDVGKLHVPDCVLLKSTALTPEERAIIQSHAIRGASFSPRSPFFKILQTLSAATMSVGMDTVTQTGCAVRISQRKPASLPWRIPLTP